VDNARLQRIVLPTMFRFRLRCLAWCYHHIDLPALLFPSLAPYRPVLLSGSYLAGRPRGGAIQETSSTSSHGRDPRIGNVAGADSFREQTPSWEEREKDGPVRGILCWKILVGVISFNSGSNDKRAVQAD